jgi:acetoin utilization deacetylase AcuC-like enzyme
VGRVTLLYRTADGEESGYWDAEQKKWVVANEYNKAIEIAVLIATKESAPDLIMVPVPAPQEAPL